MTTLAAEPAARAPYVAFRATAAGVALSLSIAETRLAGFPGKFLAGDARFRRRRARRVPRTRGDEQRGREPLSSRRLPGSGGGRHRRRIVATIGRRVGAGFWPRLAHPRGPLDLPSFFTPAMAAASAYALAVAAILTLLAYNAWYVISLARSRDRRLHELSPDLDRCRRTHRLVAFPPTDLRTRDAR